MRRVLCGFVCVGMLLALAAMASAQANVGVVSNVKVISDKVASLKIASVKIWTQLSSFVKDSFSPISLAKHSRIT